VRIGRSIESLAGGALAIAGLILFLLGMVFRVFSLPMTGAWVEEVTVYLVVWGLLLSAAGCVANDEHVRADFLIRLLSERYRTYVDRLADLAGFLFCLALAWFGYEVVDFALMLDERGPSYLQIPKAWYYAALPVSMVACSCRYAVKLVSAVYGSVSADGEGH